MVSPCTCKFSIGTNRPSHVSEAHRNSCRPCLDLATIDDEISRTQLHLIELIRRRHGILVSVNETHDFTNRIPVELTTQIFEYAVPRVVWKEHLEYDAAYDCPENLTIGTVCHRWRDIAWSTPRLWNHLSLNFRGEQANLPTLRAIEWLRRSAHLPLFLRLYSEPEDYDSDPDKPYAWQADEDPILEVFHQLWPFIDRVEELSILASANFFRGVSGGLLTVESKKSCVKRLLLHAICGDNDRYFNIGHDFLMSPSTLSVSALMPQGIDWCNLVEFDGSYVYIEHCMDILVEAPNLTKCSFQSLDQGYEAPDFIHDKVTHLSIPNCARFWSNVELPGLRFLRVQDGEPHLDEMENFIVSSGCKITTFELILDGEKGEDFISLLSYMRSLEKLVVRAPSGTIRPVFFNHFRLNPDFLPKLTHFSYSGEDIHWSSIVSMLRRNPLNRNGSILQTARPRSATFTFDKTGLGLPYARTVLREFEAIIESGIQLTITDEQGRDLIAWSKQLLAN